VVVAAFDNEPEFRACMGSVQEEIMARRPGPHTLL